MSNAMKKIEAIANRLDKMLRSDSERFNRSVKILHQDGTFAFYAHAFLMKKTLDKRAWIVVFTEHNGFHIFTADDLQSYRQYAACIPIEECLCPDECVFHPVEK